MASISNRSWDQRSTLAKNPSMFKGFVKGQWIRQAINTVDPILMNAFKLDDFKGVWKSEVTLP